MSDRPRLYLASRRRFIQVVGAGALVSAGCGDDTPALLDGAAHADSRIAADSKGVVADAGRGADTTLPDRDSGRSVDAIADSGACAPTQTDIEGPFYRGGAPFVSKLPGADKGRPLLIEGRVLHADCRTPIAGAVVDVWHADDDGHYDNDDPNNQPQSGVFRLRARLTTDAQGRYAYQTIKPSHYGIGGGQYRPAHIHYKVHVGKSERLTTQLYFAGDKWLKSDPWATPERTIQLSGSSQLKGVFDVVLA